MIAMFHAYRDGDALVVTEEGASIVVARELLVNAGLRQLRTGQRVVLILDTDSSVSGLRLP